LYGRGKGVKQDDFKALKFFHFTFVIHKSKLKAANAKIQITRLLVKLEAKALNKMISKHSSFSKRRVI
jgi:hypothetical protein